MKRILKDSAPICLLFFTLLLLACNGRGKQEKAVVPGSGYTCPMHPQIVKDAPGTCPICGMDLVPLAHAHEGAADDRLAALVKPANEIILASVKTIRPQSGARANESVLKGVINYNTNNLHSVSSRVSGRIERLYVRYTYQPVSKGQKLMDVYSPDLVNAQQELIFLKDNGEPALLESAKKKLLLLGATPQQISRVLKTGNVDYTVSIYSPYAGYVSEVPAAAAQTSGLSAGGTTTIRQEQGGGSASMGGMAGSASAGPSPAPPAAAGNQPLLLREGQYISVGQKLVDLVNVQSVWAEFYARPDQLKTFRRGTMVNVQSIDNPSKNAQVPVGLIQPYYSEGQNYSLIRASLPNANKLWKVGELVNVSTEAQTRPGNWLPRKAVLQLGVNHVVFVKTGKAFKPVYVTVKSVAGDWVDVGSSIGKDQEIAENAWFLVDSESFIKVQHSK